MEGAGGIAMEWTSQGHGFHVTPSLVDSSAYRAIRITAENCISEMHCLQLRRTFLNKIQG